MSQQDDGSSSKNVLEKSSGEDDVKSEDCVHVYSLRTRQMSDPHWALSCAADLKVGRRAVSELTRQF